MSIEKRNHPSIDIGTSLATERKTRRVNKLNPFVPRASKREQMIGAPTPSDDDLATAFALSVSNGDTPVEMDAYSQYVAETKQIKLLTAAQEQALGKRISEGNVADRLAAMNTLVEGNLRLVLFMSEKYKRTGYDISDTIQAGNIGLMHAAKKFDYTKGYRFSTYASWWIKQAMRLDLINHWRPVRVPVGEVEKMEKAHILIDAKTQKEGRVISYNEAAKDLGIKSDTLQSAIYAYQPQKGIDELGAVNIQALADKVAEDPQTRAVEKQEAAFLSSLLDVLTPRQRKVIELIYGFNGQKEHSTQEAAKILGLQRADINALALRAVNKLRETPEVQVFGKQLTEEE